MKEKVEKTNCLRLLDNSNIKYIVHTYDESITDGVEVSKLISKTSDEVFKTLVTVNNKGIHYVFMIPVNAILDLKKAAIVTESKSIEMIKQKDLLPLTGYIHGGCSPIGMKKEFMTFIDESCILFDTICFSGGRRGLNIEMDPNSLISFMNIKVESLCKE